METSKAAGFRVEASDKDTVEIGGGKFSEWAGFGFGNRRTAFQNMNRGLR